MRVLSSAAALVVVAASTAAAASTEYTVCTTQQTQQYFSSLSNELAQCQKTSSFDFTAGLLPSTDQRSAVCQCTSLIKQLPNTRVPRCRIKLDGNAYKFKDALTSIFAECGAISVQEEPLPKTEPGSGSADKGEVSGADADTTPTPTPTPAPTPTPVVNSSNGSQAMEDVGASGSRDTSIESVPEPATTMPVKDKQETSAPVTTTPTATTAAPNSSAASLFVWSTTMSLVAVTTVLLSA